MSQKPKTGKCDWLIRRPIGDRFHFVPCGKLGIVVTLIQLIEELEDLKQSAQLRANDLLRPDLMRQHSQATADAYAYVQMRLRSII